MTFPFRLTLEDIDLCDGEIEDASIVFSFDEVFLERLQAARKVVLGNSPWMSAVFLRLWDVDENVDVKFEAQKSVEIHAKQERFVITASTVRFESTVLNDDREPAVCVHLDLDELVAACAAPLFVFDRGCA